MKEHKIMEVLSKKKAEKLMDDMSRQGWEVISVGFGGVSYIITFAKKITFSGQR